MNTSFEHAAENAAAFQKMWMESASRMVQAALGTPPNSDPEVLRQMRNGLFQALAQSWEEFMRSPQFLEGVKQWMENAVSFRKMTGEVLAKARNEMQAPSRDDIDTVLLAVRHLENRLLDRLESMSAELAALKARAENGRHTEPAIPPKPGARAGSSAKRRAAATGKRETL